jgi:hypothetical protein
VQHALECHRRENACSGGTSPDMFVLAQRRQRLDQLALGRRRLRQTLALDDVEVGEGGSAGPAWPIRVPVSHIRRAEESRRHAATITAPSGT